MTLVDRWADRKIRFREFLAITTYARGYVQGIEKRGLWKYSGPEKGTGNWRAYSMKDVFAFFLAETLVLAGFEGEAAWAIVRSNIDEIIIRTILDREAEFSVTRNTVRITIPAARIIGQVIERVQQYYGHLENASAAVLTGNVAANDLFDADPELEFPS